MNQKEFLDVYILLPVMDILKAMIMGNPGRDY